MENAFLYQHMDLPRNLMFPTIRGRDDELMAGGCPVGGREDESCR